VIKVSNCDLVNLLWTFFGWHKIFHVKILRNMDAKIIFVILLLFSIELSNMSVRPKQATSKVRSISIFVQFCRNTYFLINYNSQAFLHCTFCKIQPKLSFWFYSPILSNPSSLIELISTLNGPFFYICRIWWYLMKELRIKASSIILFWESIYFWSLLKLYFTSS